METSDHSKFYEIFDIDGRCTEELAFNHAFPNVVFVEDLNGLAADITRPRKIKIGSFRKPDTYEQTGSHWLDRAAVRFFQ